MIVKELISELDCKYQIIEINSNYILFTNEDNEDLKEIYDDLDVQKIALGLYIQENQTAIPIMTIYVYGGM